MTTTDQTVPTEELDEDGLTKEEREFLASPEPEDVQVTLAARSQRIMRLIDELDNASQQVVRLSDRLQRRDIRIKLLEARLRKHEPQAVDQIAERTADPADAPASTEAAPPAEDAAPTTGPQGPLDKRPDAGNLPQPGPTGDGTGRPDTDFPRRPIQDRPQA